MYERKIKRCELLGAKKFQNVVLGIEKAKFKFVKKIFPNYIKYYEKILDFSRDRKLKKIKSEYTAKEIIRDYKNKKILLRKQYNEEQNLNYHMNMDKPTEFMKYLEYNKNIHQKGLIGNAVAIPIALGATIAGVGIALPILLLELGSAFINFECINIQDYNIYRIKEKEEQLKRIEKRIATKNVQKYGEASKVIDRAMQEGKEIPHADDIIKNIKTKEEAEQLRKMISEAMENRQSLKEKSEGGMKR